MKICIPMQVARSPIAAFREIEATLPTLQSLAQAYLKASVGHHVASNIRQYKSRSLTNTTGYNAIGMFSNPAPVTGKVVEITPDWLLVKQGRNVFVAVHASLLRESVPLNATVTITPYRLRTFDGRILQEPQQRVDQETGLRSNVTVFGEIHSPLPLPDPKCPPLVELFRQMKELPSGDPEGMRRLSHILVDANASDFRMVDPKPCDMGETPPAILCKVSTKKFVGEIEIAYLRGPDYYRITATPADDQVAAIVCDGIEWNCLGATLVELVDDGEWRYAAVEILALGKKRAA